MPSDLLGFSLQISATAQVTLERELEFTENYLSIIQVGYQNRVRYRFGVAPDVLRVCVPTLLLQPLVENAIKHGSNRIPIEGRSAFAPGGNTTLAGQH